MTLKKTIFPYFLGFFPYNSKGEQQKWISESDSTSKNTSIKRKKNIFFLYDLKRQYYPIFPALQGTILPALYAVSNSQAVAT